MRQIDADFREAVSRAFREAIAMAVQLRELRIFDEAFTTIASPQYAIADQDYWDPIYQQLKDKHDLILLRMREHRRNTDDYDGGEERRIQEGQDIDELERKAELWKYE